MAVSAVPGYDESALWVPADASVGPQDRRFFVNAFPIYRCDPRRNAADA